MQKENPAWLKSKGYLHITAQIDVKSKGDEILKKVQSPLYVAKYAFFPLIHSIIKERKYKRIEIGSNDRAHSYKDKKGNQKRTSKNRPLHYATHMDAIIFGYYAELLQSKYEDKLKQYNGLSDCIIAYRKIPVENEATNKSTIHFANEIFQEVKKRSEINSECFVLAFDIKSFFSSLDHQLLKKAWCELIETEKLPNDHYNVFKAATQFSYIMRDDLRFHKNKNGKRSGFDEKELARIRNNFGVNAFFESPKTFREKLKSGEIKIHKYPFRNKDKEPIGIPQGLPISALLANLYLLEFDLKVLDRIVNEMGCYYRRYSDDIAIVCSPEQKDFIEEFVIKSMEDSKVSISVEKTEKFHFKKIAFGNKAEKLTSTIMTKSGELKQVPFIYLGFEFNGRNILIKSANLSKFYRRMISSVKRKSNRAIKIADQNSEIKPAIFRRQLYKLYSALELSRTKVHTRWKKLVKTSLGKYKLVTGDKTKLLRSNYFTYAKRASEIMNEPMIYKQVRNHKKIFNIAIKRHLKKK